MIDKIIDKCYDFNNKRIIMWSAPKELFKTIQWNSGTRPLCLPVYSILYHECLSQTILHVAKTPISIYKGTSLLLSKCDFSRSRSEL